MTTQSFVGMWVTADGYIRHQLLPNGRYDGRRAPRALSVPAGAGLTSRAPVHIGHSDTAPRSECPIFLRPTPAPSS